jgi:uncharacterized protein
MLIKLFICSFVISLFLSLTVYADGIDNCSNAYEMKEWDKAHKLCKPIAVAGNAEAQAFLGELHYIGHGLPVNYDEAFKWLKLSAEQGYAKAQYLVGHMYKTGRVPGGRHVNIKETIRWYRLAAEQGHSYAQYALGVIYCCNYYLGVPENDKESLKWIRLAAEQGHVNAQNDLGLRYKKGDGVLINYKEAFRLFNLSAKQGNGLSMWHLAKMYKDGKGIEEDKVYAYMWFNLADEAWHSTAKEEREELSGKMTTKELRVAQELSQKCLDSNYKKCESALPNFLHRKLNLSSKDKK